MKKSVKLVKAVDHDISKGSGFWVEERVSWVGIDAREISCGFLVLGLFFSQEAGKGHDVGIDRLTSSRAHVISVCGCHC